MCRIFLVSLSLLTVAVVAQGQVRNQALDRLLRAKSLRCEFAEGTTASWDRSKVKLERGTFGKGGITVYDSIDIKKGTARLITSAGAGDVAAMLTAIGITFIESVPNGGLNIATAFARYLDTGDEYFISVMSKHVDVGGGPLPSQWHGACRILE